MSNPIDFDIQAALCTQIKTPDIGYPISWPFVTFTPAQGVAYLEVRPVLRGAPVSPGLSFDSGSTIRRGIFQVDAVVPQDAGEALGIRLAGLVATRFAIGTKLVAGGYRLQVDKPPNIAAAVMDAPWARFPVSIPYLIITQGD